MCNLQRKGVKIMNDFLPQGYETPESEQRFMELVEGANTFRILSSAIVGYEWWVDTGDGGRVPIRVRTAEEVPAEVRNTTQSRAKPKHFWAFVVYNYQTQSIQVLELKQQTILRAIEAFVKNPKWGNPQQYDLLIEKVKTGSRDWDVEYNVIPEPPSPLDPGIAELAKHVPVRLEALYNGEDPFAVPGAENTEAQNGNVQRERPASRKARAYS
jgi:hypothetical protein